MNYLHENSTATHEEGFVDEPTLVLDLLRKFSNAYSSSIKGKILHFESYELFGGAKINHVFRETFSSALKSMVAPDELPTSGIVTAMQNASGIGFARTPLTVFELIVKREIQKLRQPCLQCVDLIHTELKIIVQACLQNPSIGLTRFPKLQSAVFEVVSDLLDTRVPVTNEMVNHFINVQLAHVDTQHPDLSDRLECCKETLPSSRGLHDCDLVQNLIKKYFSIVKDSILDIVPKIIMHFLVNYSVNNIDCELVGRLFKHEARHGIEHLKVTSVENPENISSSEDIFHSLYFNKSYFYCTII